MSDDIEPRVRNLELWQRDATQQIGRLVSDADSEKETRSRINRHLSEQLTAFDARFQRLERVVYTAIGALGVLQAVIIVLLSMVLKIGR